MTYRTGRGDGRAPVGYYCLDYLVATVVHFPITKQAILRRRKTVQGTAPYAKDTTPFISYVYDTQTLQ